MSLPGSVLSHNLNTLASFKITCTLLQIIFKYICCHFYHSLKFTLNNVLKLCILFSGRKSNGISRQEVAHLLDHATRTVASTPPKKLPPVISSDVGHLITSYNTNYYRRISRDDPYEFIDEIDEITSPSYKEYSIQHSPVKFRKRSISKPIRYGSCTNKRPLRKSARILTQLCVEMTEEEEEDFE